MQGSKANLFMRDDTFFGVCEAIGEDFGFNPIFLRVALGVSLLWNPVAVLIAYVGLALLVMTSRLLYPNPKPAAADEARRASADPMAEASSGPERAEDRKSLDAERLATAA